MNGAVDLAGIRCNGRPKGFVPYRPREKRLLTLQRVLRLYEEMDAADALPIGPRQDGYRLSQLYSGEYDKRDFKMIEEVVTRAAQAGLIPFDWIADASADERDPGGYDGPDDYVANLPEYRRDLRHGQPVVPETFAEARETLPLIERVAAERGVFVYSGSGSGGPKLACRAAERALRRAVEHGQGTLILGICDFDRPGIEQILRPHIEHVSAFLYGTDRPRRTGGVATVLAWKGKTMAETDTEVTFRHLALTPEYALGLDHLVSAQDLARIRRYIDSEGDLWTRDLRLLDRVQKIETEALDPRDLRQLVVEAIEDTLDMRQLRAVRKQTVREQRDLAQRLTNLAAQLGGGPP